MSDTSGDGPTSGGDDGVGEALGCEIPDGPRQRVLLEPVWGEMSLFQPTSLELHRASARWYATSRDGGVWTFPDLEDDQEPAPTLALDLRDRLAEGLPGETGLVAMALHPDFESNGRAFFSYYGEDEGQPVSEVVRMDSPDGGQTFDPATEVRLIRIEQDPSLQHGNADMAFGPDGLLYVGFGDGGPDIAPTQRAQDPFELRGKILRLDVDGGSPYAIPSGNPFADGQSGAPEVFALGLRNPWRFSFHPETGELWVADVGGALVEEVNVVRAGGNYGWPAMEGETCRVEDCDGFDLPVTGYPHNGAFASITGGFVYRGDTLPWMRGRYVASDFVTGTMRTFEERQAGFSVEVINEGGFNVATMAEDAERELLFADFPTGRIYRLSPGAVDAETPDDFPRMLSETGCVDVDDPSRLAPGFLRYEVTAPLWSDGAAKARWAWLPAGTEATVDGAGGFEFPVGTVLVKEFETEGYRVETRFYVRHDDGAWGGYSYVWDPGQTDAYLAAPTEFGAAPQLEDPWPFPTRRDCGQCHNGAAGVTLGLTVPMLDRTVRDEEGQELDQLTQWTERGWLAARPTSPAPFPDPYAEGEAAGADVDARARAYLDTNCAPCHRPGSGVQVDLDLRATTPLAATRTCDVAPVGTDLGIADPRRIAPGDPERSLLLARMGIRGEGQMPPLASNKVDGPATELVRAWIASLEGCE